MPRLLRTCLNKPAQRALLNEGRGAFMEDSMFDELVETKFDDGKATVRRLIPDQQQLSEIELVEASIAFANAENSGRDATELEVALLNKFMKGETSPLMHKAWSCYRRRLLLHHRKES
jgi:hypothetical protein